MPDIEHSSQQLQKLGKILLSAWDDIRKNGWNRSAGEKLHATIAQISHACADSSHSELVDKVLDVEVYLSSFIDSELQPDPGQLAVLEGLVKSLPDQASDTVALPQATRAVQITKGKPKSPPSPRKKAAASKGSGCHAFILKSAADRWLGLSQELGKRGYIVAPFLSPASLIKALGTAVPQIVIVEGVFCEDLPDIENAAGKSMLTYGRRSAWVMLASEHNMAARLAAMQSGMDAYISGPIDNEEIVARVEDLLTIGSSEPYKVMIIDDDRQQALYCDAILRRKGMSTYVCHSGQEALDLLETCRPDLIIVDLHMPGVDGLQFTAQVRDRPSFFTVPIIFLSGEQDPQKRYDALSLGGDDFLIKPITPNHLLAAIWSRLKFAIEIRGYLEKRRSEKGEAGVVSFSQLLAHASKILSSPGINAGTFLLHIAADEGNELEQRYGATEIVEIQGQFLTLLRGQLKAGDFVAGRSCLTYSMLVKRDASGEMGVFVDRVLAQISGVPVAAADLTLTTTFSIGACPLDVELIDVNHAVKLAGESCRQACSAGGNRVQFSEASDVQPSGSHQYLKNLIDSAGRTGFGEIQFQPLARLHGHLKNQYRVSFLVQDVDENWVDLPSLIDDATPSSVAARLDFCMLTRTLKDLAERVGGSSMEVGIRVSVGGLCKAGFVDFLKAALKVAGIDPRHLTLVFPIDEVASREVKLLDILECLQMLGVRACATRFEGRSDEFSILERLPLFSVELGAGLLEAIDGKAAAGHSLIGQIHDLGLQTVIGQVDSAAAMALAWGAHSGYALGNFVQPPATEPDYDFSQSFAA